MDGVRAVALALQQYLVFMHFTDVWYPTDQVRPQLRAFQHLTIVLIWRPARILIE